MCIRDSQGLGGRAEADRGQDRRAGRGLGGGMSRAHSLLGSGDWVGGTAKWIVLVIGAGDQSEAYDKAATEAPETYLGVPRGAGDIESHGGGLFTVTFTYT